MVDMQPIARSSSNMSSMSVDAEPVSPMFRLGEMPISPYDDDLSSAQLSQDAIAGVPPRGRMHAGEFYFKLPVSSNTHFTFFFFPLAA